MSVEIDLAGAIKDEDVFTKIYDQNLWYAGSGYGSNPAQAEPYLEKLQGFFDNHEFKTIIDLGCGDWRLMERIDIPDAISYNSIIKFFVFAINIGFKGQIFALQGVYVYVFSPYAPKLRMY